MKRLFRLMGPIVSVAALAVTAGSVQAQQKLPTMQVESTKVSASKIPVETFMRRQEFAQMSISPNGDQLAALVPIKDRDNLVVIDLVKRTRATITTFTDNDVVEFSWINNNRLFFRVADGRDALGRATYLGTYAINIDGSAVRNLTSLRDLAPLRTLPGNTKDEMLVTMSTRTRGVFDVHKLNTLTGRTELLTFDSPGETQDWVLDWDNVARITTSIDPKTSEQIIWHRPTADAKWTELFKNSSDEAADSMEPLAFESDNKTLYVASNVGRDKFAIFKYDTQTKKLGELIFEHPLIDIRGGLIWNRAQKKLLGISYDAEKRATKWLDPKMEQLQKDLDSSLKNTNNTILLNPNSDNKKVLVSTLSATDPGGYFLYDDAQRGLEELPRRRPWLDGADISPRQYMPYTARDGLKIPAWVTIPKGSTGKNLPLIVNIHGGPNARVYGGNAWSRYSESPFFASRGYVVLEPEPRGSTEFGKKHLSAGYKQWGQTMQDDITDGVLQLIKDGVVDKNKVCLYGGSYGGYATLQGLVKEPEMFKCGVPWIAVSDLVLLLTDTNSDTNNSRFDPASFQDRNLGNVKADRAMLEKYSPVNYADKIKAPVFLVMGELDVRVPLRHGTSMRDAMKKSGVKHEFLILPGEAHGFNKQENIVEFMSKTEKFFAENLK
jgi:dipeptidyl aminopeptidase/acylaminoacyl peptidase